jgi:hypothetical protein
MRAIYTREKIDGVWQPYRNIIKQGTRNSHESGPFFINILVPDGNGGKKAKWHRLEGATDIATAKKMADRYDATQDATASGLALVESKDGTTTVALAVEQYLRLHQNDRPKTVQQYTTALKGSGDSLGLLKIVPAHTTVKKLATADVLDRVVEAFEKAGYSKKTVHTRMGRAPRCHQPSVKQA